MKQFKYKAKKGPTEIIEGTLLAETKDEAIDKINEIGLLATEVVEVRAHDDAPKPSLAPAAPGGFRVRKVKSHELVVFYRQLAKLAKAGVPILKAIGLIGEQSTNLYFRGVLSDVQARVRQGEGLSGSLATYQKVFTAFDLSMIQAGESVGKIDEALTRIAEYREKQEALNFKVKTALAYPIFVIMAGIATVVFMLSFVIPKFSRFFLDLGQNLPLITRILIDVSGWSKQNWGWLVIAPVAAVLIVSLMRKNRAQKMLLDRFILMIPKINELIIKKEVARLGHTLSLLIKSGMPVLKAIQVAIPVLSNEVIRKELETCYRSLEDGGYFSEGLKRSKRFPVFVSQLVHIGEESGKLDEALTEVATWYEQEIDEVIKVMMNLLEPTIILVVGLVLGFIIVAVLLPVFSMNALVQ